jgi:glycosyltransferase involved in cell wall biosynthesis
MDGYITSRYRIPVERRVPIPVGIDPEHFSATAGDDIRAKLGLDGRPVILSLGHVIPVRDRLALVESVPLVLADHPRAAFLVVGRVYDDRFLRRAEELGVGDHLIATGPVAREDVPAYVAAADVEAHDLSGYGLGTAGLEVMAAGVPAVVAVRPDNFPGIELRSWDNVVLVRPDDPVDLAAAINRLLDNTELRKRIGESQRLLIDRHFSIEAVADRHEDLYRRLAGATS